MLPHSVLLPIFIRKIAQLSHEEITGDLMDLMSRQKTFARDPEVITFENAQDAKIKAVPGLWEKVQKAKSDPDHAQFTEQEYQFLEGLEDERSDFLVQNRMKHDKIQGEQEGYDKQDKEIAQFYAQKKQQEQSSVQSIAGKSLFTEQDAQTIINGELSAIKTSLSAAQILPQNITFIFYSNGNVGTVATNPKASALLRRDFVTPLQMMLSHYLITNKKYFATQSIKKTVNVA